MSKQSIYWLGGVIVVGLLMLALLSLVALVYIGGHQGIAYARTGAEPTPSGMSQLVMSLLGFLGGSGGATIVAFLTWILGRFGVSGGTAAAVANIGIETAKLKVLSKYYSESGDSVEREMYSKSGQLCTDRIHGMLFPVNANQSTGK